ncbi:hypothetical protein GN958_ATG06054 [Phytophthora infestans]|uniref:Uncharacterized protein n=1 Tax=Phytophthora infestans TaxID=4787 RepID=A0A8S9V2U1_PHYIN|nr:hypothetical protein GN958_ATG06054 [Phytophthora infestans]
MTRPPLPLLGTTVLPRPPSHLPLTHRELASPRPRTLLPHFSSSNAGSISRKGTNRPQPEDFSKTPLEKSIDDLKRVKSRVRDSFARMNQTQEQVDLNLEETSRLVHSLEADQRHLSHVYANLLDFSARQIQRCFREHLGRRLFRQILVIRAVLRVQRKFREFHRRQEDTRKKSRVMYRKVLRGLRGVRGRDELSHAELLNRVGHNLQVECQWRKAMGVKDSESDLITALYRKKYVRRKLGAMFRQLYWVHSIALYWRSLPPRPEPTTVIASGVQESEGIDEQGDALAFDVDGNGLEGTNSGSQHKIVIVAPRETLRETKAKKDDELRKEEETAKQIVQTNRKQEISTQRNATRKGGQR